jgi:hypothetical protein
MAAPGYDLYYLNVMAGPGERAWRACDDPAHAWVRDGWAGQDARSATALREADRELGPSRRRRVVRYDRRPSHHIEKGPPPMGSAGVERVPDGLKRRWPDIRPEDIAAVQACSSAASSAGSVRRR